VSARFNYALERFVRACEGCAAGRSSSCWGGR